MNGNTTTHMLRLKAAEFVNNDQEYQSASAGVRAADNSKT